MRFKVFFFLLLFFSNSKAQFNDNFSDSEFSSNPTWTGDATSFLVVGGQLRSESTTASTTFYLSTASTATTGQWEFYVNLQFSTSSANYVDVALMSDAAILSAGYNGYFVRIGGTLDEICLYKKTGLTNTKIIDGLDAQTNSSNNTIKIKVTRDAADLWTLQRDLTGSGTSYFTEGTITEATYNSSAFFGIAIVQSTATFFRKHFFDEFYVGPIIVDTTAPSLLYVTTNSENAIDLLFSEAVEINSAQTKANYSVNGGIGIASTAIRDISNTSMVHLTFATNFSSGFNHAVTINGVSDISGNAITNITANFLHYEAKVHDVLIHEIMCDPDPPISTLPNYEYIELYNRSSFSIPMKSWTITAGSGTAKVIPDFTIAPNSYLILCGSTAKSDLQWYGNTLSIISFPGLSNSGTSLTLRDNKARVIHTVNYSNEWYSDTAKANGGYSLEMKDATNPCGESENWTASKSTIGGTPGTINASFESNLDTISPKIIAVHIIDLFHVEVLFSETIDSISLLNSNNYLVDNGIQIVSVKSAGVEGKAVILTCGPALFSELNYHISFANKLTDCSGNAVSTLTSFSFSAHQAKPYEVLFSEVMPDPDPSVFLPPFEYIELFNKSNFAIDLHGWKIMIGSSEREIKYQIIQPGEYLIVCDSEEESSFRKYGKTLAIDDLPSLTNAGSTLVLRNQNKEIISVLAYRDTWYGSNVKSDGGWSLEMIDPLNPCAEESNWSASTNDLGGTLGKINSISKENPDAENPQLIRISIVDSTKIRLHFNEPITKSTLLNLQSYIADNGFGEPINISVVEPTYKQVILTFSQTLTPQTIYTLTVSTVISDCVGNPITTKNTAQFALPEEIELGDIVINEILFNPHENGVDFVELYNRSEKVMDLKYLLLANYDTILQVPTSAELIDSIGYLIFPHSYYGLSESNKSISNQYVTHFLDHLVQVEQLPALGASEGSVILMNKSTRVLDKLLYNEKMHFPLLNDTRGVSLERLDYNRPSDDLTNWHSASESVGFATPAVQNSQFQATNLEDSRFTLHPEVFSPDNDGYNDNVTLTYSFEKAGNVGNLLIFDASGRLVRNLLRNELLSTSGSISWNGMTDQAEKAEIGIYIIYFEAFTLDGDVVKCKKTCVLAAKLD